MELWRPGQPLFGALVCGATEHQFLKLLTKCLWGTATGLVQLPF